MPRSREPGHVRLPFRFFNVSGRVAPALCLAAVTSLGQAAAAGEGPTVRDVVEFTRIVQPHNGDPDQLAAQVSPDGKRAFIVTRRADVATDTNRYEILLLDVRPERLSHGKPDPVQTLITVEARTDENYMDPSVQDVRWAGDRTLLLRARMDDAGFQVYSLDVATRRLRQLTFESRRLVSFAVSQSLDRVVYAAQVPQPPMLPGRHAVVVGNQSFWSVKHGQDDWRAQRRYYQYFVAEAGAERPARPLGEVFPEAGNALPGVDISPDGRWALLHRWEPERQLAWGRDYPLVAVATRRYGPSVSVDPLGYFSRPSHYVPRRLVAWRLADARPQDVIDAPDDALPGDLQRRGDRLWLDGGQSVLVGGTHLPVSDTPDGPEGVRRSHVVEYWPDENRSRIVTALSGRLGELLPVRGRPDRFVVTDAAGRRLFERLPSGGWAQVRATPEAAGPPDESSAGGPDWRLRVAEGLDVPPDVVADGPEGRSVTLTTLNPQFDPDRWGRMQPYSWSDDKGRRWDGGLMTPRRVDRTARHALVIQTYGFAPDRFYLDGSNRGDGHSSGFAGRAFLREGILVLALPIRAATGAPKGDREAILAFIDAVRGAVDILVADGLVDRDRVGILGWSATGERVLNLVTFGGVPMKAASILDGDANTLFSAAITYAASDNVLARKERTNEGSPFGASLADWVRNDPSLHTDCIRAALRIETYGPWVLNNWDVYALMRRQYKPVEMVVIPGGSHALSRPAERMVSLQGNVDWHRFWLKGEERSEVVVPGETAEDLRQQYLRWRQMVDLKRADDAKPPCAARRDAGG